jgi:protein O-GlcNAc transferase
MQTLCLGVISVLVIGGFSALPVHAQPVPPHVPADSLAQEAARAYVDARYATTVRLLSSVPPDSLSSRGLFTLGSAYSGMNDFEQALRCLRKAVEREPGNSAYRFQLARMLATSGMMREAETEYGALLVRDSLFTSAHFALGLLAVDRREYALAAKRFQPVLQQQPRDYLTLYYLGVCSLNMELLDSARAYFAASLTLNPRYGPALNSLASLYYKQGNYRQALRLFRSAVRDHPDQAEYWYSNGLCLEKLDDQQGARDSFREATRLDSTNSLYYAHLGQVYFDLKKFDSSAAAYVFAVRLDEENPVLLLNLGLAYARLGEYDRAEQAFKQAAAAYEPEQIARVHNQLGALFFLQRKYPGALKVYGSALRYDPSNLEARFYSAVTLDQMKRYEEASASYRRYLKLAGQEESQKERITTAEKRIREIGPPGRSEPK